MTVFKLLILCFVVTVVALTATQLMGEYCFRQEHRSFILRTVRPLLALQIVILAMYLILSTFGVVR